MSNITLHAIAVRQFKPLVFTRAPLSAIGTMALAMLLLLCWTGPAAGGDPLRYRPGLRNSPSERKLNVQQLDSIVRSLREKTGFAELRFDDDGFLTIGDQTNFSGGSATARALITAAMGIKHAVDLEAHPRSIKVSFARIAEQITYESRATGAKIEACTIQMDFNDFSQLRGDKLAIEAFDVGLVLMHELGHTVMGLHDSQDNSPGDCEEVINRIRRELGLPERQTYIAQVYSTAIFPAGPRIKRAELLFKHMTGAAANRPDFRLNWDATQVGPVTDQTILASSKPRTPKPVAAALVGQ